MKFLQFLSKRLTRGRKKRATRYRPELYYMRGRQHPLEASERRTDRGRNEEPPAQ